MGALQFPQRPSLADRTARMLTLRDLVEQRKLRKRQAEMEEELYPLQKARIEAQTGASLASQEKSQKDMEISEIQAAQKLLDERDKKFVSRMATARDQRSWQLNLDLAKREGTIPGNTPQEQEAHYMQMLNVQWTPEMGERFKQIDMGTEKYLTLNKPPEAPKPTSDIQNYEFYRRQEMNEGRKPLSYNEWKKQPGSADAGLTPIYGKDAEGRTVLMQMTPGGTALQTKLPEGVTPTAGVEKLDLGTAWGLLDSRTGQVIGIIPKEGDVPPGYTVGAGEGGEREMRPMPGSPAEKERRTTQTAAEARVISLEDDLGRLEGIAKELLTHPGLRGSVGFQMGASKIPGTDAANFVARLEALKSQVGFNALQKMREMSKTGGAVGQVSNYEQELFQQQIDTLSRMQSEAQFKKALQNIVNFAQRSKKNMRDALRADFGAVTDQPQGEGAPAVGTVQGGYRFKGGDPAEPASWENVQ